MRTLTVAAVSAILFSAAPVLAQPYPGYEPPATPTPLPPTVTSEPSPAPQPAQPVDPYGQPQDAVAQPEYDPNADYDPDIDGYDAEYDISYDNQVAESYDDGYDPNAYQQFEGELQPYGDWVEDPTYGHVWSPSVAAVGEGFSPYATGGHWVLTEYGWTWVSDWAWGWAPFHYGRWLFLALHGWCWIPGSVWGPGWVSWRAGGGYVGWAPLPPRGVVIGPPTGVRSPWRFAVAAHLGGGRINYLPAHTVGSIFGRTRVVSNGRTVTIGGARSWVNAGPTGLNTGIGVGISTPATLRTVAPHVLPRVPVTPRAGVPLEARPWVRAARPAYQVAPPLRSVPIGPQHTPSGAPVYRPTPVYRPQPGFVRPGQPRSSFVPPARYTPPAANAPYYRPQVQGYRPAPVHVPTYQRYSPPAYSQPSYRAPAYSAPTYHAPTPTFRAPATTFHAPAPSYHAPAPSYHAPAPSFRAPSPSYHAPSTSHAPAGGHSFGGGRGGRR